MRNCGPGRPNDIPDPIVLEGEGEEGAARLYISGSTMRQTCHTQWTDRRFLKPTALLGKNWAPLTYYYSLATCTRSTICSTADSARLGSFAPPVAIYRRCNLKEEGVSGVDRLLSLRSFLPPLFSPTSSDTLSLSFVPLLHYRRQRVGSAGRPSQFVPHPGANFLRRLRLGASQRR